MVVREWITAGTLPVADSAAEKSLMSPEKPSENG
jgi:hypothetical protein